MHADADRQVVATRKGVPHLLRVLNEGKSKLSALQKQNVYSVASGRRRSHKLHVFRWVAETARLRELEFNHQLKLIEV